MDNKRKHFWLKALGRNDLPETITAGGQYYRIIETFKHDFFAATGLYERDKSDGRQHYDTKIPKKVVLKVGRTQPLLLLPMRPIGRWLAKREGRFYNALQDLDGVPMYLGLWNNIGVVHEFIEGHPLRKGEQVNDEFFPKLFALIKTIHLRHMAYVDLEKRENILVGDDGNPYLIDFQISFGLLSSFSQHVPFARFLLRKLQRSDEYHLLKHRRRHRPDQLSPEEIAASYKRPIYVEAHRIIFRPLTQLRRAFLRMLLGDKFQPRHEEKKAAQAAKQASEQREKE